MNARRPTRACRVTSAPQLGPMNDDVTSDSGTSYASARAVVTARESACSSWSVCTRTPSPPTIVTCRSRRARRIPRRRSPAAASAFSTPAIWNCEPPRNSMLKLTAAEDRHEYREQQQHGDDRVPLLAAADEVERALARVEVVSECGEPVGHQDSLPSLVPLPLLVPLPTPAVALRSAMVCRFSASLRARGDLVRGHGDGLAEFRASAVHRAERIGVEARPWVSAREELRLCEQLQHRMREQDHDDHVDDRGETERVREAAHAADREDEQHDRREQVRWPSTRAPCGRLASSRPRRR